MRPEEVDVPNRDCDKVFNMAAPWPVTLTLALVVALVGEALPPLLSADGTKCRRGAGSGASNPSLAGGDAEKFNLGMEVSPRADRPTGVVAEAGKERGGGE